MGVAPHFSKGIGAGDGRLDRQSQSAAHRSAHHADRFAGGHGEGARFADPPADDGQKDDPGGSDRSDATRTRR